jgi:hypothetical protein
MTAVTIPETLVTVGALWGLNICAHGGCTALVPHHQVLHMRWKRVPVLSCTGAPFWGRWARPLSGYTLPLDSASSPAEE